MADTHTTEHEFGKGVTYAAPIDLNAKKPLDARFYADTIADRDRHYTEKRCYPGMSVYVGATGLTYIYDGERETLGGEYEPIWLVMADRNWVTQQIVAAGGMTEEAVRLLIEEVLAQHEADGKFDDIKVYTYGPRSEYSKTYTSMSEFPAEGTISILYLDGTSGSYYKWDGTQYVAIDPTVDYKNYFPVVGIEDVQYIDSFQNVEYIWDGSRYEVINKIASSSEIENLFD